MTSSSSSLTYLWPQLLYALPIIFVAIAAVVVCIMNWQKAPTAAMFCLIGFGLIGFNAVLGPVVTTFIIRSRSGESPSTIGEFWSIISVLRIILSTAGLVFLLIAVFTGRTGETSPSPFSTPPSNSP